MTEGKHPKQASRVLTVLTVPVLTSHTSHLEIQGACGRARSRTRLSCGGSSVLERCTDPILRIQKIFQEDKWLPSILAASQSRPQEYLQKYKNTQHQQAEIYPVWHPIKKYHKYKKKKKSKIRPKMRRENQLKD